jgi:hypothetical protein
MLTDHLGSDENIILRGGIGTFGLSEETEPLVRNLDDSLREGGLRRRPLLLGSLGSDWCRELVRARALLVLIIVSCRTAINPTLILPVITERSAAPGAPVSTVPPARAVEMTLAWSSLLLVFRIATLLRRRLTGR